MKQLNPRDKITQKMTRDGLIEVNETQQTAERISSREQDSGFSKPRSSSRRTGRARLPSQLLTAARYPKGNRDASWSISSAQTRKSKKAVRRHRRKPRALQHFPLAVYRRRTCQPGTGSYIEKSDKAADRLDAAKAAIPKQKNLVKERTFDEAAGKAKTRLRFEEQEKPIPGGKAQGNPLSRPAQEAGFSSITRYIPLKRTIPALRGRINQRNLPSAARNTGRGN